MPLLKILPSLISQGSFTGSFSGTSSYARRSLTASYVMGGAAGSSGTSGANGSVGSSGTSGTSATAGSSGTSGVGSPGTSGTAGTSGTSSTATVQTGSIASQTLWTNVKSGSTNTITGLSLSSNKWNVSVVEEWDAKIIPGDQYYNSCSLLMHFNGVNGSTTFTDNSPSPKTVTSVNGAAISTVQSKFGGASGFFDGSDDYLTVPDNSAFDFGAGDFTIEYWEYRTSNAVFKPGISRNSSGQPPWMVGWTESGNINFFAGNGSSWSIASAVSMGVIIINSWTHYAVTRQGNTFRTFQNGTQISTFTSTATIPNGAAPLEIGRYAATYYYPGYLDELRLTKGVARYTGNFTPENSQFYNNRSLYQSLTKYIGTVGGLNDTNVDYGVQKLNDSSLKVVKMTTPGNPSSGSLSASIDRVYVNVLDYSKVSVTSSYATNALTASYILGGGANGSSGTSGATGAAGTSGTSGNSGTSGSSGTSATAGSSGTSGVGSPGTSGTAGSSGVSGTATVQTGSIAKQTIWTNVTSGSTNTITGLSLSSNKWDVSVVEEWDAINGDLFYNSSSLLMHFSGSNGSTTFIDNSPSVKTVTSNNGAAISSLQSKFGNRSGLFDGVDDYLSISGNTVCNFGSSNFTVECWVRLNAMPTSDAWPTNYSSHFVVITAGTPSLGDGIGFMIGQTKLIVQSNDSQMPNAPHGMTTNTWYHIAYVRSGNNLYFFVNGSQVGTTQTLTGAVGTGATTYIGCETGQGAFFNGYMDELRVTKGIARYTSNFTAPSAEFGNVRGQVATKYIGSVGGLNDRSVDYGVQKLSDSSLRIVKMSIPGLPYPAISGSLSASVDRVYVNVLDYTKVSVTSSYARNALTASYVMGGAAGSNGTSGANGSSGQSGTSGSSGTSGINGTSGSSGTSATAGSSGSSGSSGTSATAGSSGTSGVGSPGTSGTAGSSGTSSTSSVQTGSLSKQTILYNVTSGSQNVITGLNLSGNKWGVDIKEEWDAKSVTGDQYYNSCSLLLHCDGTNGSTTFTDNSPRTKTVTSNNGAAISTVQSKFGGASGFFDGTDDYLSISYNSDFNLGTDSFTWESWIYPTNISGIDGIYATSGGSGVNPKFVIHLNAGTPSIHYNNLTNGSDLYTTATSAVSINTWTHLAFVRNGSNWTWYINGNSAGTGTNNTTITFTSQPTYIGYGGESYFTPFNGYIDELRVTKGVARYTGNFTPSTTAFPNNAGVTQYATKYVGLIGGLNDKSVDYGIQKLSDSSLKVVKMTQTTSPFPSGSLSASVDRVYVNVLDYTKVSVTSSYSLLSKTASYALNASGGGGSTLRTGSTYPITSSWSRRSLTSSYALNGGTALVNQTMKYVSGSNLYVLSRSVVSPSDVLLSVNGIIQTPITDYTVSASRVTFTESYPSGSKINARYLVTATNSSDVNLANIVLTGTTTGDAYYPQVAALLHFDGTNGSTVITDNSKNNFTLTVVGNAQISTAQSKFGGSSLYLDGTGDRLTIASPTTDLSFGTGDFTIETWVYKTVASTALILDARATADAIPWIVVINSSNFPYFYDGTQYVSTVSITLNSWVHLAVVRTSGVLKIFVNGVQGYSAAHSVNLNRTAGLIIGDSVGLVNAYAGYIDELRITNGYARYTGNFTPSTTAFSNTGGDVGKALVVNSTATGVSIGTAGYLSSQLAKAWVNFNGTGTVAIRDSYNVSSITDDGTGQYRVNFSNALSNANYVHFISMGGNSDSPSNDFSTNTGGNIYSQTTTYAVIVTRFNGALYDSAIVHSMVFSN